MAQLYSPDDFAKVCEAASVICGYCEDYDHCEKCQVAFIKNEVANNGGEDTDEEEYA